MHAIKKNILLISPHPDDIAYSCLLPAYDNDNISTVLTVFGQSKYAYGSSNAYNADWVTAIRKSEDLEFCSLINAKLIYLDYADSSISFSSDKTYIDLYPFHRELAEIIKSNIFDHHFRRVYFPMALGWHYDHKIIRDIILKEVAPCCDGIADFVMYEDLPYTLQFSDNDMAIALMHILKDKGYTKLTSSIMKSSDTALQRQVIDIYKSQYETDTVRQIIKHKIVDGNIVERFHRIDV